MSAENNITRLPVAEVALSQDIKNWATEIAKPRVIRKTTIQTIRLDPAGTNGAPAKYPLCDFEPLRAALKIMPIDKPVCLTLDSPLQTPDVDNVATAPQGGYLPVTNRFYEFYGPDAFFLNTVAGGATRVTIVKEYYDR